MSGDVNGLVVLLIAIVVVAIGVGVGYGIRRHAYVKALRARGWTFDANPPMEVADGLTVPPFGVGFHRDTDELVSGRTSAGVDFQVFEYAAAGDARVVCLSLGVALPELVVTGPDGSRAGVVAPPCAELPGGHVVLSAVPEFARAFLGLAGPALAAFAQRHRLDLAVDGDRLTQVGAPKDPAELQAYLEALAPVATAVVTAGAPLAPFHRPPPRRRLGFYRRPTWAYDETDDTLLDVIEHTGGGMNHRTSDVVRGELFPGACFAAFEHHWQTQRTETSTDAQGRTHTRTVTENHAETLHEVALPFDVPDLQLAHDSRLGRMIHGGSIDFELTAFNDAYDVRCTVPKFAHDVLHPRQIEYLLQVNAMPFRIERNRIRMEPEDHSAEALAFELDVLAGFFARWPPFVWHDLGVGTPPVTLGEDQRPRIAVGRGGPS